MTVHPRTATICPRFPSQYKKSIPLSINELEIRKDQGDKMAVQKSRKTRSRRDMRRSHDALGSACLSKDAMTGETHLRHHISPDGYYKGRQVLVGEESYDDEE